MHLGAQGTAPGDRRPDTAPTSDTHTARPLPPGQCRYRENRIEIHLSLQLEAEASRGISAGRSASNTNQATT